MKIQLTTLLALTAVSQVSATASWAMYGSTYESQSASQKSDALWTQITKNTKTNGWFNAVELGGIFLESMDPTMQWVGDTFKDEMLTRKKYIHSVGNVGKVKFEAVPNNGYTGVFEGADYGYIRLSCAAQPNTAKPADANFIPGMGLKLLRNGVHSANLVAMFSVNGQSTWNFFQNNFTNHIPSASGVALTTLAHKFATATPYVQTVGLSDFSNFTQDGQQVSDPKFPWQLIFTPSSSVANLFPSDYTTYYTDQLATVPAGTTLYNVYALATPTSDRVHIGDIVLQSQLTTSYFGDKYMFYKHQDMRDDLKFHPEWTSAVPTLPSVLSQCPFKELQQKAMNMLGL